jgi:hypothetical protein
MKQFAAFLLSLLAVGFPLSPLSAKDPDTTTPKTPASAPTPANETRKTLAIHKTDAQFVGLVIEPCRHRTAECPDRCDHGGTYAEFKILNYRLHEIKGQYGSERTKAFSVRVSNVRRQFDEAKLNAVLTATIKALKPGDKVRLEWTHDYVTRVGSSFPEHPVSLLEPAFAHDESPIKSSLTSIDSNPEAIATAEEHGAKSAAADIAAGRFRILEYGERRQITEATKDPETGFRILPVAGCKVPALVRAEADAYNKAMRDWHARSLSAKGG